MTPEFLERKLISVKEVSAILGCSTATVWRYAKKGIIPQPIKLSGTTRWSWAEIDRHISILINKK